MNINYLVTPEKVNIFFDNIIDDKQVE